MGDHVFNSCTNLKSAVVDAPLKVLPGGTFTDCIVLESVKLPEGLTKIEGAAFQRCHMLTSIEIPSTVTEICGNAFQDCGLKEVVLPEGLQYIDSHAFDGNEGLVLTLPSTITGIGNEAFNKVKCIRVPRQTLDNLGVREDGFKASFACGADVEVIE